MERAALLLSYLIKMINITTNNIATDTATIFPAIGFMSGVMQESIVLQLSYLIKMTRITTTTITTTTAVIPPAIGPIMLIGGSISGFCADDWTVKVN